MNGEADRQKSVEQVTHIPFSRRTLWWQWSSWVPYGHRWFERAGISAESMRTCTLSSRCHPWRTVRSYVRSRLDPCRHPAALFLVDFPKPAISDNMGGFW